MKCELGHVTSPNLVGNLLFLDTDQVSSVSDKCNWLDLKWHIMRARPLLDGVVGCSTATLDPLLQVVHGDF